MELQYDISNTIDLSIAATSARHRYNYSEVLNDIDIDGNDIDTAPKIVGNVQLGFAPSDDVRFAVEWHYISRYFTDAENLHQYNGHNLFNLRGSWQLSPALSLSARILNVSNRAYAERADYSAFEGDRYYPGRPRHFSLSLQYQWL